MGTTQVSAGEFVDARLEAPRPSRIWYWWLQSTARAVIRKVIGLDADCAAGARAEQAIGESLNKQVEAMQRMAEQMDKLAAYAVNTEQRLGYYETNVESMRYLREKLAKANRDGLKSGLVLLNRQ